jgi:hypothetical protein
MVAMKPAQRALLRDVLARRRPDLLVYAAAGAPVPPDQLRIAIQETLSDEFVETGLEDSEPNRRGLELEDLIDVFGAR